MNERALKSLLRHTRKLERKIRRLEKKHRKNLIDKFLDLIGR